MDLIDWNSYRDLLGFITGGAPVKSSTGNVVLFAAIEKELRKYLGTWSDKDHAELFARVTVHCQYMPGLLRRPRPFRQDQEQQDDYIGYVSISESFAESARIWGLTHFYRQFWPFKFPYQYDLNFNDKAFNSWLGRHVPLIAHMKFKLDLMPPLWQRLWWALSVAFSGSEKNQDPWVLNWLLIITARGRTPLIRWASRRYWRRLYRTFPRGLADVWTEYFDDPNHPFVQAWLLIIDPRPKHFNCRCVAAEVKA